MNSCAITVLDSGYRRQPIRNQDYYSLYPKDWLYEEMNDTARVWRVYNDEADRIDAEAVDKWNTTLDTLLIFVSILSKR